MKRLLSILLTLVLVLSFSLVTAVPAAAQTTINVPADYVTIQLAIDSASSGDTIVVAAGTYTEDLTIPGDKTNLELTSASGAAVTTIKGVQELDWPTHAPAISVLAIGVKIHGFTIESPDYSRTTGNPHSSGITVGAADVEIYDNRFVATDDGTGNSLGWSTLIETYGAWSGDVSGLNIHDNTFTSTTGIDKGSEGIYIYYNPDIPVPVGTVTIANNTFGGQIFRAITTERSKTTITGNNISSSFAAGAAYLGISISSPGANLNPNQDTVVMTGNTVNGFYEGIRLGDSDNNLTNISLTNNTVETNMVGIKVHSSADGVVVNFNDIDGNTTYGVENTDTDNTLDAKYNWWGAIGGPSGEGLGNGDSVSANVDYDPWLTETQAKTVTDGIAYFGSTIPLEPGWNTLSVPLKLKDSADTMSEIMDLGDFITNDNVHIVYQYKSGPGWDNIGGSATELVPLRGYYIKILGTDTVYFPVLYSGQLGLPTLNLSNGWNLIGSGFGIDKTEGDYGIAATTDGEDGQKDVATALYSIKDQCSVVVSPSTQGQVAAWGTIAIDIDKDMIVGEAYWVFMTTPAPIIVGFEVTPIYYLP